MHIKYDKTLRKIILVYKIVYLRFNLTNYIKKGIKLLCKHYGIVQNKGKSCS